MKKLISWKTFRKYCKKVDEISYGYGYGISICKITDVPCNLNNCPVWKRLEKVKGGER